MPSPAKTYMYAVMRTDNTSVLYEWTSKEYETISLALENGKKWGKFKKGMVSLENIRAIVEQEPPKEEPKILKSADPEMDAQTTHWVRQQKELARIIDEEDDYDYEEGGRWN